MATIRDLKTKLLNANTLGRTNLAEKGVEVNGTETTYEIMNKIADVSSGGSKPQIKADSCVAQVILPVVLDTVTAEINNGTIEIDSSASLEE